MLEAALGAGITFLDTAAIYGGAGASERLIGEARREMEVVEALRV